MTNPLTDFSALPCFDQILPEHIGPAIDQLLAEAEEAVKAAEMVSPVTWDNFVIPSDDATEKLGRAWNQVAHLEAVASSPEVREAYNANLPKITRFDNALGQNLALFAQYRALVEAHEYGAYNEARRRVVENALRDFRLGGAELADDEKARFGVIKEELAVLSANFSQNLLDATDAYALYVEDEAELAGLPADVIATCRAAASKEGKPGYKLGLQMPCYLPIQCYAENRGLRETLYRANAVRASELGNAALDNSANISRILALRAELARLLGYANYAEYSLATKMAQSPDEVLGFLRDLATRAKPYAQKDRVELEAFSREQLGLETLEAWDVAYATEKLKQARYLFSAQEVKPYFTEPKVLAGLFDVIRSLYGLKVEPDDAPVWHEEVRFFRLTNANGELVGQFYLDLYAREGKRGGAWMDDCRNRRNKAHGTQTPVVYLICNFGKGMNGKPATFNHHEVITLFHEMGHGLHQLLTEIGELGVAGINGVEWDAVELPSQFMENFCWEWKFVQAMTAHADTGDPLPRKLFDKMLTAKNYQSGMSSVRQLEFALFDMELHISFDPMRDSVQQLLERVRDDVAVNRPPVWHRSPHQFSHIFAGGYAGGYYSYKWAEVLSADAYAAFEETPRQIADTGARFRREVLARGGSRSAADNFSAFRGRVPKIDALLRHHGMAGGASSGPYLLQESDGGWVTQWIESNDAEQQVEREPVTVGQYVTVPSVGKLPAVNVRLRKSAPIALDAISVSLAAPILVVADTHGEYEILVEMLQAQRVIDRKLRWSFGRGHLVFLGDVFDRGSHQTEILWLIYKLEVEAAKAGGGMHFVLGNHEAMVLCGDLRYLNSKYLQVATALGVDSYSDLFGPRTMLGQWLRSKPAALKLNDMLLLHGGISPEVVAQGLTLAQLNTAVRNTLNDDLPTSEDQARSDFVMGPSGPLWYRGYFAFESKPPLASAGDIDRIREHFGVRTILVGHTMVPAVAPLYDGDVIAVHVYPRRDEAAGETIMEGVMLERGIWYRARIDGTREPLTSEGRKAVSEYYQGPDRDVVDPLGSGVAGSAVP